MILRSWLSSAHEAGAPPLPVHPSGRPAPDAQQIEKEQCSVPAHR